MLNNLLNPNPKVGVFYAAVLPQFVSPHDPVLLVSLLLATIHALMGIGWYWACAWGLSRGAQFFRRGRVRAWLEALTRTVLVALGPRVAVERP